MEENVKMQKSRFEQRNIPLFENGFHLPPAPFFLTLTPLIGRQEALTNACSLLQHSDTRLLTLTGIGGVGKTRLALQVATELRNSFADGIFFLSLASVSDPQGVITMMAHTLGLRESEDRSLFTHIKAFLRTRHLLLVLDTFEHVLTAAPLLSDLLSACPFVKLLVTSRAMLRIEGEHECPVLPLLLPDLSPLTTEEPLEAIKQSPAVQLFLQRVQAIQLDFHLTQENAQTVAEICIRLDGLPLALELAATRIKLLPPQELLSRLNNRFALLTNGRRDLPQRQKTLRNTITWSYDLLSAEEQMLLRSMAVFVGGCQLEALEALCLELGGFSVSILDSITHLIDHSLVHVINRGEQEPRLILLETIREFALEMLAICGETERVQKAHASYYKSLAEHAEPELYHHHQCLWLRRLEQDHENLQAVLTYLHHRREWVQLASLVGTLSWFWYMHGLLNEGQVWAERVLVTDGQNIPDILRGRVIAAAGMFAGFLGQNERAFARCQESIPLCKASGSTRSVSASTYLLVHSLLALGEVVPARAMSEDMLTLALNARDSWVEGAVHCMLGSVTLFEKNYEQSCKIHERGIALFEKEGDLCMQGITRMKLANVYIEQGQEEKAQKLIKLGVENLRQVGAIWSLGCYFTFWGQIALKGGQGSRSHFLLQQALSYQQQMGDQQGLVTTYALLAQAAMKRQDDVAARTLAEQSIQLANTLQDKEAPLTCLEGLASVSAEQGRDVWAAQLWGTIEQTSLVMGMQLSPFVCESRKPLMKMVQDHLGEQVFASAWERGKKMTPIQVLASSGEAKIAQPPAFSSASANALTKREREVLRYLAQGLTNAQIADQLLITRTTVNSYLRTIYSKLGVTSRASAIRYSWDHKLIE